jgi:hypothetical protein
MHAAQFKGFLVLAALRQHTDIINAVIAEGADLGVIIQDITPVIVYR